MKTRDLAKIGIPAGRCAETAKQILQHAHAAKRSTATVLNDLGRVATSPAAFLDDASYAGLAQLLVDRAAAEGAFVPRETDAPYRIWGENIEASAVQQLKNACQLPVSALADDQTRLTGALERETRFGIGASFRSRRQHDVMDADWRVTSLTSGLKDRAWAQLGTSGSGNHFVEFGRLTVFDDAAGLSRGEYFALLSHSGSRGTSA